MSQGLNLITVSNRISFQQNEYGEDSLKRNSAITSIYIDGRKPDWHDYKLKTSELIDETKIFYLT